MTNGVFMSLVDAGKIVNIWAESPLAYCFVSILLYFFFLTKKGFNT